MLQAGVSDPKSDGAAGNKEFLVCIAENAVVVGGVVDWSTTGSTTYPFGFAVVDSAAGTGRAAGIVTDAGVNGAIGDVVIVQRFGYNTNVTTDGNVAAADLFLTAGAAVAIGATPAEVNAGTNAAVRDIIAWNANVDAATVGQCFILL